MNGLLAHAAASLRLHFRNRLALVYGYVFPLLFLVAFGVIYRHEQAPLLRHLGEILTVGVLGGACFGLPTTLVSERERGLWRRFRLTPAPIWTLVASSALVRFAILASASLLQLAVARAAGMPWPADPLALALALSCAAFAFIGLGLVIAMLADNVPAVQAIGQCVFLPMLVIGGVAVRLDSLPDWAREASLFLPGRYAVAAIQAAADGTHSLEANFSALALVANGLAGVAAATLLFRWEAGDVAARSRRGWATLVLACWVGVGLLAGQRLHPKPDADPQAAEQRALAAEPWRAITSEDVARLNFNVPPDSGVVTPMAGPGDSPNMELYAQLDTLRERLPAWAPGRDANPANAVRNLLYVAGVPDVLQDPVERYVPYIVYQRLNEVYPKVRLIKILTWIALHPEEGPIIDNINDLGIPGQVVSQRELRRRSQIYAIKFVARLTGRVE